MKHYDMYSEYRKPTVYTHSGRCKHCGLPIFHKTGNGGYHYDCMRDINSEKESKKESNKDN